MPPFEKFRHKAATSKRIAAKILRLRRKSYRKGNRLKKQLRKVKTTYRYIWLVFKRVIEKKSWKNVG